MSELEFESRKCYICHRFNINPVTPPCDHELCLDCFEQNAEKVSYSCPICRKRNSTWLRLNKKKGLVNTEKEKQIRESFPLEVEKVLNGEEIIFSSEHHLDRVPSEPGEIAKDFELLERKVSTCEYVRAQNLRRMSFFRSQRSKSEIKSTKKRRLHD